MKTLIFATTNQGKLNEIKQLLPNYEVKGLNDIGYTKPIIEDGKSFKENALIKARTISLLFNSMVVADDSGLEVMALNGAPGIYSARYAGYHSDEANNKLLIKNLEGVLDTSCRYVCALCLFYPDGRYSLIEEYCYGYIIDEAKGCNGFGYDPYFYSTDLEKTFAEASIEEKNQVSHRAKALKKLKELLNENPSA